MRDSNYLEWIRGQPCRVCSKYPPVEAHHHTGHRGMGQKSSDYTTIPLCHDCHMMFHAATGPFTDWDKGRRRQWQDDEMALCAYRWALRNDSF